MAKHQKKHKVVGYRNKYYSWRRNWKDRISELPDDVLVSILSLLPGVEAVATCVLSRRWEKLWTFTTGTLSFSHPTKWLMVETQSDEDRIKPEFINWVNHALRVHQGPTIQEFCIKFGLDESSASDIDTWIYFAIKKKAQRLHFDFRRAYNDHNSEQSNYNFPNLNLLRSCDNGFSNFIDSLTELSLAYLNVDESLVQYFLSSCPNLEKLCLEELCSLVNLRVAAPLKLKHLEISYCYNLKKIEIAAPNLAFLKCIVGYATSMTLKNVPKLVEAHMSDLAADYLINNIPDHLSPLSQLEALTLDDMYLGQRRRVRRTPKLLNLKRLVLTVFGRDDEISLLPVIDLLKAAPFLHTFVLEFSISRNKQQDIREVREDAKYQHQYLKVVELSRFAGRPIDVQLASHLIKTAISLEKITIHTNYGENRLEAKERAKQLKEKLPAGAELVVL